MIPSFRPPHDRVLLTARECRTLARMECELDPSGQCVGSLPSPVGLMAVGLPALVTGAVFASGVVLASGIGLVMAALLLAAASRS